MEITKDTAKRLYGESPEWFRAELEEEFGAEFFSPNYFENIATFEDACAKLGIKPEDVTNSTDTTEEAAYKKLKVVVRAINTDANGKTWVPDWNNTDEQKWWPWFLLSSGFGFDVSDYDFDNTITSVGSRLCFQTKEQSDYCATRFLGLYNDFLTIKE
jgi:hypothetical protein